MSKRGSDGEAKGRGTIKDQLASSAKNEHNDCKTFFTRMAKGFYKKASAQEKKDAQDALDTYQELEDDEKKDFVQAFKTNKGSKNFGWVKDFSDRLASRKTTKEEVLEKYMTRISLGGLF